MCIFRRVRGGLPGSEAGRDEVARWVRTLRAIWSLWLGVWGYDLRLKVYDALIRSGKRIIG